MNLWERLRKKKQDEEQIEEELGEVPQEELPERKRIDTTYIKWGAVFGAVMFGLFLFSRMLSGGNNVVVQGDIQAQKRILEQVLKSQADMNQKILQEIQELKKEKQSNGEGGETRKSGEEKKSGGNRENVKTQDLQIVVPGSQAPPPPPPPPPSATFQEVKPAETYKPKINRIERKEENKQESKNAGKLYAQAGVTDLPVFSEGTKQEEEKKQKQSQREVYLPAGTTLKGRIINSFPAPVGGEKFPAVLIELDDYARLPNNYRIPMDKCLVIAKAEGSYVLSRAKMETYRLTCILKTGRVIEVSPKGMIVSGEDGMEGVGGKFLNINREQLLMSLGGGTLSGFFSALQNAQLQQNTSVFGTTTNVKNEFLYALYGSLAQTWNQFAQWYLDQAKQMLPVVVVSAGKPVYITLVDGISLGVSVDEFKKGL